MQRTQNPLRINGCINSLSGARAVSTPYPGSMRQPKLNQSSLLHQRPTLMNQPKTLNIFLTFVNNRVCVDVLSSPVSCSWRTVVVLGSLLETLEVGLTPLCVRWSFDVRLIFTAQKVCSVLLWSQRGKPCGGLSTCPW